MYLHLQTYLHARVCVRSFYKREENRESETIKVVQSINERKKKKKKKKIGEKEEKKDRCMHRVFSPFLNTLYFNIVNLWNIR